MFGNEKREKQVRMMGFSIYDKKAEAYNAPIFFSKVGTAIRQFSEIVKNSDSIVSKYPHDFALYHVCNFNDESGHVESLGVPKFVIEGSEVANQLLTPMEVPSAN